MHISVNIADGVTRGVGMPYIADLNEKITDGRGLEQATHVTVNGRPADARWYFEHSDPSSQHLMEGHLRLQSFWPADSSVHVTIAARGRSGGRVPGHPRERYVFDDDITSDFAIGDARVLTVSNALHTVTVTDNGRQWGVFPVSLGAPGTPTRRGTKVIMEKLPTVCMHDVDYHYNDCGIKDDQRLTYDGEYLHAAPWNCVGGNGCVGPGHDIGTGNSSNGCTNLTPTDATKLYTLLEVGDVVEYPDADGPRMKLDDGYGDWNVTWGLWLTGGVVPTS